LTPAAAAALMTSALSGVMLLLLSRRVPSMSRATSGTRGDLRLYTHKQGAQDGATDQLAAERVTSPLPRVQRAAWSR
jgi:hypothetical protein